MSRASTRGHRAYRRLVLHNQPLLWTGPPQNVIRYPAMVYDKAKWHSDGDFPKGLPYENGGTHIGMFLAWAIINGMASDDLIGEAGGDVNALRQRQTTGRQILFQHLDGVLSDEELNGHGNAFAAHYYKKYMGEYDGLVRKKLATAYHAADDWITYDQVAAMIDKRYSEFRRASGGPEAG